MSIEVQTKYRFNCDRCDDFEIMLSKTKPEGWIEAHEDSRAIDICSKCAKSLPEVINEGINKEAEPHHLSEERINEIAEYELEHLHTSDRLSLNGRLLFSLIREVRLLRKMAKSAKYHCSWWEKHNSRSRSLDALVLDIEEWEKYK
jgi:hypothetical protein